MNAVNILVSVQQICGSNKINFRDVHSHLVESFCVLRMFKVVKLCFSFFLQEIVLVFLSLFIICIKVDDVMNAENTHTVAIDFEDN